MENARKIIAFRDRVLIVLKEKMDGFFLAGGTALSICYLRHRESYDIDFFTKHFSRVQIENIVNALSKDLGKKIELTSEQNVKNMVKMMVYSIEINKECSLRLDFVEDIFKILKDTIVYNGISVLSMEDIYLRKIYTVCGSIKIVDDFGRNEFTGGRQEAKDFFDLYYLSKTFIPISVFVNKYCSSSEKESIIVWYSKYDRMSIKTGILDIITDKTDDYGDMQKHFESEKDKIIKKEIM